MASLCVLPSRRASRPGALLAGTALALLIAGLSPSPALSQDGGPSWQPQASERLVKLPASYLKKSLDHDFAQSELGQALRNVDVDIAFKVQTLADLQRAVGESEGEVNGELRHQFLAEKRAYIDLISRKNGLRREHLETRLGLMEQVLARLGRDQASLSPARLELIGRQEAAQRRFEGSISKVDLALLEPAAMPESKYAREYAKNLTAIETLVRAIDAHPMSAGTAIAGQPLTKQDSIRQMVADTEAELALLDQEEKVLGYMAKLVALDALALSEEVMNAELIDSDVPEADSLTTAVGFFVKQ